MLGAAFFTLVAAVLAAVGLAYRALRAEPTTGLDRLEARVAAQIATLRDELRAEIASLRDELRGEIASLRDELRGEIASLRDELRERTPRGRGRCLGMRTRVRCRPTRDL